MFGLIVIQQLAVDPEPDSGKKLHEKYLQKKTESTNTSKNIVIKQNKYVNKEK